MTEHGSTFLRNLEQVIQDAPDAKSLLETYHLAGETKHDFLVQEMVAKKFLELGNVDAAIQFTLLSEQTKNQEKLRETAIGLQEIAFSFGQAGSRFKEGTEDFDRAVNSMRVAAQEIDEASRRMNR